MQLIKTEFARPSKFVSFWAWLWFTKDYPFGTMYGEDRHHWWRYCGSDDRLLIRRRFGWTREHRYNREEFSTLLYMVLHLLLCVAIGILIAEIGVLLALWSIL